MSKEFLEIVELPDGRIILRRSEDEPPMVTLMFSKEARELLKGKYIDVAKSMFHAGLQTAGQLAAEDFVEEDEDLADTEQHTLH